MVSPSIIVARPMIVASCPLGDIVGLFGVTVGEVGEICLVVVGGSLVPRPGIRKSKTVAAKAIAQETTIQKALFKPEP